MKKILLSLLIVALVCQVNAQKTTSRGSQNVHLFLIENNENEDSYGLIDLNRNPNNAGKRIQTLKANKVGVSEKHKKSSILKKIIESDRKSKVELFSSILNSSLGTSSKTHSSALKTGYVAYNLYLLDSIVAYQYPSNNIVGEMLLTYDNKQRVVQIIESEFEDGEWDKTKEVYTYNKENQIDTYIAYMWDAKLDNWSLYYKYNLQYNSNNNIILEEGLRWNESINNWINDSKTEAQFDSKGNEILTIFSEWKQGSNNWIKTSKYEKQYDSNGKTLLEIRSEWNVSYNDWIYDRKSEMKYDSNSNLSFKADYVWSTARNDWDGLNEKKIYEYNNEGNLLLHSSFSWNSNSNDWEQDLLYAYDNNGFQIISLKRTGSTNGIANYSGYKYEDIRNDAGSLTQHITYDWDNSIRAWLKNKKYEYSYDAKNNETLYVRSNWNVATNNWDFKVKNEYTYDANNNNSLILSYTWNASLQNWDQYLKYEYSYDSNNLFSQLITYSWNITLSTWANLYKYVNSRDNLKNVTLQEIFSWNTEMDSWEIFGKDVYNYDKGYITDIYSEYDSSTKSWVNREKLEYAYDSNENQTLYAYYEWNKTTNTWVGNGEKYEKTFDNAGRQTLDAKYWWNNTMNTWEGIGEKYEKAFDSAGRQILKATYNWSNSTNAWKGWYKDEYEFDDLGRKILDARYDWNEYTNNWRGMHKDVTTYFDFTTNMSVVSDEDLVIDNIVYYVWNTNSRDWVQERTVKFYYSGIGTEIKNIEQNTIRIYPTVASSYVTVNVNPQFIGSTFTVTDISGRAVLTGTIYNETTNWDVSQWPKGVYLLKFGSHRQSSLKIIKW